VIYVAPLAVASVIPIVEEAGTGQTVLGSYPRYVELADELGAKRFNIPEAVWNTMTAAERWAANKKFLDRMIARGDMIILSNSGQTLLKKEHRFIIKFNISLARDLG
jgi:hypothetical protein